jgi:hypothetical protein
MDFGRQTGCGDAATVTPLIMTMLPFSIFWRPAADRESDDP